MEVMTTEGSSSNDAIKDIEKAKIKLNGDMNGSMEGMEVDADSHDSEHYQKDFKESLSGENSNDSAEVNNGEHTSDSEGEHSGGEDSRDVDSSQGKKHSENSNSQHGFHESMDIDGDGASLNSEEEDNLLNSDNEGEQRNPLSNAQSDAQYSREMEEETEEDEEEGDINKEEDDKGDGRDVVEVESDENTDDEGKSKTMSGRDTGGSEAEGSESGVKKTNGDCRSDTEDEGKPEGEGGKDTEQITPKKKKAADINLTPRRSSRTVQRPVRFGQESHDSNESEEEDTGLPDNESDEIEEITPQDPLGDALMVDITRNIPRRIGNTTIVVNDAKRLADIAARNANSQKKEPTLVIIDTNSILSGRGAVPVTAPQAQVSVTLPNSIHVKPYPALPVALPAQGLYPPKPTPRPPPILPTLTDDMYVVEAPSFIVPYVYEKPPVKKFKKYLKRVLKQVRKQDEEDARREEEEEEEERRKEEESAKKEKEGESAEAAGEGEAKPDDEKDDKDSPEKEKKEDTNEKTVSGEVKDDAETKISEQSDKLESDESHEKRDTVSLPSDNVEDVLKVNEIKKEDGQVKVKESKTPVTKPIETKEEVESSSEEEEEEEEEKKKPSTGGSYFDNPLGKFFMQIGMNLVQEFVQTDLLKQHKKKQKMGKGTEDTQAAIMSLKKNLQLSKENNEPYTMEQSKCDYCSFKTESKLIMAHHLETPHMRNYVYRCNFCPLEVRGPHDILFHMEAEHNIRGRLERAPAFHQCPQCPFEDNQKGKLTRHLLTCQKKFRPEKNLEPPMDWEPPAKIPRLTRKPPNMPMNVNNPLYQQALASKNMQHPLLPKMVSALNNQQNALLRARGRPSFQQVSAPGASTKILPQRPLPPQLARANMVYRTGTQQQQQVLVPTSYQISGNQIFQVMGPQGQLVNIPTNSQAMQRLGLSASSAASLSSNTPVNQKNQAAVKLLNQPSISITPLPRQSASGAAAVAAGTPAGAARQGSGSKTTFVICEICDGYIKDLEQLRNHMQWIHKVKIHPKMIYNRPPLNCQKCQFRFFTDQGLERHLLGSHGLVTSSMQDSANKGKDGGRCPVCGRVYQWKLLNHVARDHSMTLKPAHLSYKCTVCTATFGMYKQFENHVYSAHSVVAKRVMDKKNGQPTVGGGSVSVSVTSRADTATLLKPLKINDEITIIPQPAKKSSSAVTRPVPGTSRLSLPRILQQSTSKQQASRVDSSVQIIDLEDSPLKHGVTSVSSENGGIESLSAVKERLRRRKSLEIRQVESEPDADQENEQSGEESEASRSKVNSGNEEDDDDDDAEEGEDAEQGGDGEREAEAEGGEGDEEDEDEDEQEDERGEESEG